MKSFSVTSYPSDYAEALAHAEASVKNDPLALFTDFQWFLYRSRNTVYFTAYSTEAFDRERLHGFVAELASLAPQLTHGFRGARPGQPFAQHMLDAITSIEEVDSFEGYPDKWLEPGEDLFEQPDLPLFRVKVVVRRDGPDAQGRTSMVQVRTSHAVMEGTDSALLSRSHFSGKGSMNQSAARLPFGTRFKYGMIAALSAPIHMIMAQIMAPRAAAMDFRTLTINRSRIRAIASALRVSQRAVVFGLAMYAVNNGGKGLSDKKIRTVYTMLDNQRADFDDDFFRVRVVEAPFDVVNDLVEFIKSVDCRIKDVESKDYTQMHYITNATFSMHRMLSRVFPFLYSRRFFRFDGGYHMVLTMIPPHRMMGPLTRGMMEPVYCGSYHPGSNLCTFVPARENVTLNFVMREKHTPRVDAIMPLLERLEAEVPAHVSAAKAAPATV